MRDYEVVYIFRADLETDEVDERLDRYHDRLGGGEVTAVEHWGQRKLAYEIRDERKGYYVVVQFRAEPSALGDFEQGLKHDEGLLRHLIVLSEGELPTPPSQRREEEEEEEEAEDEEAEGEEEGEEGEEEDEPDEGEDEEASDAGDEDDEEPAGDEAEDEPEGDEEPGGDEAEEGADEEEEEDDSADDDETEEK